MAIRETVKFWFNRCMTEPDVNSRFIFLVHGLSSALAVIFLTVAFVFAKSKDGYDYMVLAASGSATGAAAVGRWMTKKGGADSTPPDTSTDTTVKPQ